MAKRRRVQAAVGDWGSVECVVRHDGSVPAKDFLKSLGDDEAVFFALFDEMARNGRTDNPRRFKHEEGRIYAFKKEIDNRQVRFPCFSDGNIWVLTHGFYKPGGKKKKGKWPRKHFDRANELMAEYFEIKKVADDKNIT